MSLFIKQAIYVLILLEKISLAVSGVDLTILQQTISIEQMTKLLTEGRTDLLDSFVSSRTRRKFKAFLILKDDKTIGFEFVSKAKKN